MPGRTPFGLTVRMLLVTGIFFALVWLATMVVVRAAGGDAVVVPLVVSVVFLFLQYMISPWIVAVSMGVRYVEPEEEPEQHALVGELAAKAGIPKPRVGVSELGVPNAFAFGRWRGDGRVCVTRALRELLTPAEMRAVLGHEVMHIRNRDMMVMTLMSLFPNLFFYLFRIGLSMRGRRNNPGPLIALFSILVYFVLQLLVLFVSRIREDGADAGAVRLGTPPHHLASALFKLVYGSARLDAEAIKGTSGFKAFFASDPSRAYSEIQDLAQLDRDHSGTIEAGELEALRRSALRPGGAARLVELLSTHPNMVKRIRRLSEMQAGAA